MGHNVTRRAATVAAVVLGLFLGLWLASPSPVRAAAQVCIYDGIHSHTAEAGDVGDCDPRSDGFTYDAPLLVRADVHRVGAARSTSRQFMVSREWSASPRVETRGASTTPSTRSVATEAASPGLSGVNRVGSALKTDAQHAFPDVVDNFAAEGSKFSIPTKGPGGVVVRNSELFQVEGSLNGRSGVFEWIVDQGEMTHRRFIPGGKVTGYPNQVPTS